MYQQTATTDQKKKQPEQRANAFTQNWWILDIISVLLHVIAAVAFALLPDIIVIFS